MLAPAVVAVLTRNVIQLECIADVLLPVRDTRWHRQARQVLVLELISLIRSVACCALTAQFYPPPLARPRRQWNAARVFSSQLRIVNHPVSFGCENAAPREPLQDLLVRREVR